MELSLNFHSFINAFMFQLFSVSGRKYKYNSVTGESAWAEELDNETENVCSKELTKDLSKTGSNLFVLISFLKGFTIHCFKHVSFHNLTSALVSIVARNFKIIFLLIDSKGPTWYRQHDIS